MKTLHGAATESLRRVLVPAAALCALLAGTTDAHAATLVVDRDRAQCAHAAFTSIQAAVDAASAGDLIKVCPDVYAESVTVDKPLTLRGNPDAVEAVGCFDEAPSQLGDLDPTEQTIVDGTGSSAQELFALEADDIVLKGFVLQGAFQPDYLDVVRRNYRLLRRAIATSDAYSGYRIRHNLIRLNSVGIQFGSRGTTESRFDHNCLRENVWGLATDDRALVDARVDHNATFRTRFNAFEPVLGEAKNASFDHNLSRQDDTAYKVANTTATRIVANTVQSARIAIDIGGGAPNVDLQVIHNLVENPFGGNVSQGIFFRTRPADQAPNTRALVMRNTVTGMALNGITAAGPPVTAQPRPSVTDSVFSHNLTSDNGQDGITLRGGNDRNTVRGNIAERNGRNGIYLQGAVDTLLVRNTMLGNGINPTLEGVDARDDARAANTWIDNHCVTDIPTGAICGTR
jgi:parallel beta-helix repeat protein